MSCCESCGDCFAVPRNRAIASGIANVVVAVISGLELAMGQLFIFNGLQEERIETTTPQEDKVDTVVEFGHGYDKRKEDKSTTEIDRPIGEPSCMIDIVLLAFIFAIGLFTLFACNTKSHRRIFANLTRACLALCIVFSATLAILILRNDAFPPTILIWGSVIQIIFWKMFESFLKEPGLEPVPTGPRNLEEWRKFEDQRAYEELGCFRICCCDCDSS